MPSTAQSGTGTAESDAKSVDTVNTPYLTEFE